MFHWSPAAKSRYSSQENYHQCQDHLEGIAAPFQRYWSDLLQSQDSNVHAPPTLPQWQTCRACQNLQGGASGWMIWFPKTSLAALRCDEPGSISYTFINFESTLPVHRFNWCKVSLQIPILMIILPLYDTLPCMNIKRFREDPAASQYYTPQYRHTNIEFPIKLLGGEHVKSSSFYKE